MFDDKIKNSKLIIIAITEFSLNVFTTIDVLCKRCVRCKFKTIISKIVVAMIKNIHSTTAPCCIDFVLNDGQLTPASFLTYFPLHGSQSRTIAW